MNPVSFISENRIIISIIAIVLLVLFIFLGQSLILIILIIGSILLSSLLGLWKLRPIGIELVLLTSIIAGMTNGSLAGAVIAVILITVHMIATQHINVYLLWVIPAYVVAGFLAGTKQLSITMFGLFAALGVNIFNLIVTALIFRANVELVPADTLPKYEYKAKLVRKLYEE